MINLVRAGETGGFLDKSLDRSPTNFEKEVKLRGTIKSALTYPVVVLDHGDRRRHRHAHLHRPGLREDVREPRRRAPAAHPVPRRAVEGDGLDRPAACSSAASRSPSGGGKNKNTEQVRKVVDPLKLKLPVFGQLFDEGRHRAVHPQLRHHDRRRRAHPAGAEHRRRDLGQLGHRGCARSKVARLGAAGQVDRRPAVRESRSSRPWSPR